jgi:predicted amidohydrolase
VKVAALQMDIRWESPEENMERAGGMIARAAEQGAGLVALPEMFSTGFSMNTEKTAEPRGGPVHRFLAETARRLGIYLVGTMVERVGGLAQNVACLFGPDGSVLLRYAKVHPFRFAGEHLKLGPGSELPVAAVEGFHLAVAICYDLRFPELFRALCFRGADLFVVPANWPRERISHWSRLLAARAIENQAYVVGVNRVGSGGGLSYNGRSAVIDPMGESLAEGSDGERLVIADLKKERIETIRKELPFLADHRKDLFPLG